jgi:ribose transport system substrate-binding protein
VSGCRCEIELKKPLHNGHFKTAAAYHRPVAGKGFFMRISTIGLVCLLGSFTLIGCGPRDDRIQIAVIPKCTTSEFWETVEEGARQAADELNVAMRWEGTLTETAIAEQNKIVENMITLDVDGIALAPLNRRATAKAVKSSAEAQIPVVIFDSAVDGDAHISFVATNNTLGGELAAKHMKDLLGEGKKQLVVFRFVQGTASTEDRGDGFIKAANEAGYEIVEQTYAQDGSVAGCKKTAANTLEGYIHDDKLELDGIFCCNDRSSMGTAAALDDIRESGVEVNVKVIGFDFPPKLIASLQAGKIDATIAQDPRRMGYLAVEILVKHLRGEEVSDFIDTGVKLVTRELLKEDAELRKLVGADEPAGGGE